MVSIFGEDKVGFGTIKDCELFSVHREMNIDKISYPHLIRHLFMPVSKCVCVGVCEKASS